LFYVKKWRLFDLVRRQYLMHCQDEVIKILQYSVVYKAWGNLFYLNWLVNDSYTVGVIVTFPYILIWYPGLVHPLHCSPSSPSPLPKI
jgi:hypothetical protein